ncbi:transposase [Mycolicibacterium conceptionense]|uniref:transposase n=1 Tax=Mycolicibacterium conceptionense TaxID=451644 RepID=UPI0010556489|nr:transposase [Mycolicibacterium conceptionense]
MTHRRLRQWRGVVPVAVPSGVAVTTRLRTTVDEDRVLDAVAGHVGRLRRADLAAASRPVPVDAGLDADERPTVRRARLNARKRRLTTESSSRWASAIIAGNDDQYRLARDAQYRHICGLRSAITTIETRLAAPTVDTLSVSERQAARTARREAKAVKGYASQAEQFQKQRRLQHLQAELARAEHDRAAGVVHVVQGGKRLAKTRHHLDAAGLTIQQWRQRWDAARWRLTANGSPDEPFGNLTITITPAGQVSIRLPKPLEHLANAPRGRFVLSGLAVFSHRGEQWAERITGGHSISYTLTRRPGRAGVYVTGSWALPALPYWAGRDDGTTAGTAAGDDVYAEGPVVGVDLNDGHLAVRRLDAHGNPVGAAKRIDIDLTGASTRRDARVRHAITRLLHYTRRYGITTIAVENLTFADARATGRETMGRGTRGKRFRRTVAGIPTAVFRNRLTAMATTAGINLYGVNPAYSSIWGAQHWQHPYRNVTRHQAAATVIGRRAQGFSARRRKGVTPQRPEDRAVRATNQTEPKSRTASTGSRHEPGTRVTTSRRPSSTRTRQSGRATVIPAQLANNGQLQM